MKKRWNRLQPCEKKAAIVAGVIGLTCLVASVVLDIHDRKNGGAN